MNAVAELPTVYQQIIFKSRYARWNEQYGRRETWPEAVTRYCNFFHKHILSKHDFDLGVIGSPDTPLDKAFRAITSLSAMPSMRCLMTAGPALEREAMCGFNCTYQAIDSLRAFDEIMYILMCGCGAGFSVERQYVNQLPIIPKRLKPSSETIVVQDSREGWASAFRLLLERLYQGNIPEYNTDLVRSAGSRLKTMGGYASGPGPLVDLFKFTIDLVKRNVGDRLNSLDCHDLVCKIGDIVVMGGVRRSALISLSNLSDGRMAHAKAGQWYVLTPWRALANNSVCYTERPTTGAFMSEWLALYDSKSGERGVVNRIALREKCRRLGRRVYWDDFAGAEAEDEIDFGVNPCAEIVLRSMETCNLSEVIARPGDTIQTLSFKASAAAMLGTWQASLSDYGYVRDQWRINAEEERLLGVSITGVMDSPLLGDRNHHSFTAAYKAMYEAAVEVNEQWADQLKINHAAAITCIKPSGTVSQLCNTSSGVHGRHAPRYIRRITMDNHDPMTQFMIDIGLPSEPSCTKPKEQTIFEFPIRSPQGAQETSHNSRSAIEQLEHWHAVNKAWADHSVSCTIEVEENEWPQVGGWIWEHFDDLSGLSFIPKAGAGTVYRQLPFETCDEETLVALEARMPKSIDWNKLSEYEKVDTTVVGHERACVAGACAMG